MNIITIIKLIKYIFPILCLLVNYSASSQTNESIDFLELRKTLYQDYANDFAFAVLVETGHSSVFAADFEYMDKKGLNPVN